MTVKTNTYANLWVTPLRVSSKRTLHGTSSSRGSSRGKKMGPWNLSCYIKRKGIRIFGKFVYANAWKHFRASSKRRCIDSLSHYSSLPYLLTYWNAFCYQTKTGRHSASYQAKISLGLLRPRGRVWSVAMSMSVCLSLHSRITGRSSAIAERLRDALVSRNFATTKNITYNKDCNLQMTLRYMYIQGRRNCCF